MRKAIPVLAALGLALIHAPCAAEIIYQTDFANHFFDSGTFAQGNLTGDGWIAPQGNPWYVEDNYGNRVIKCGNYDWSQLDLAGRGRSVTGGVVRITCSIALQHYTIDAVSLSAYQGTNYANEIGRITFTKGVNQGGQIQLVGSATVIAATVSAVPQQLDWVIDLSNKTMTLSIDGKTPVTTGFANLSFGTLDQIGLSAGNLGSGWGRVDHLRVDKVESTVYSTDFTQHFFDSGTFGVGNLAGDGWEAPLGVPVQVDYSPPNQLVKGTSNQYSALNLASKSASVSGRKARVVFTALMGPNSIGPAWVIARDGNDEIGRVEFTKGYNGGGQIRLIGSGTVTAASVTTSWQQIDWQIDPVAKSMSLSVSGGTRVSTGFANSALDSIDFVDIKCGELGAGGWIKLDDLDVTALGFGSCQMQMQILTVGDLQAQVSCGAASIYHNGSLVLRDAVTDYGEGAPMSVPIQGANVQGVRLTWSKDGRVFAKTIVVKPDEALLEYSLDTPEPLPVWSVSVYMPQATWGISVKKPTETESGGMLVGNTLELQYTDGTKLWDPAYSWLRQPYWNANIAAAVGGEYSMNQTAVSAEDPRRLRAVVRFLANGAGLARGLDTDYVDRGNPAGNLSEIIDRRFTILACRDRKFCKLGEQVNITLMCVSDDATTRQVPVSFSLSDQWGRIVEEGSFVFDTAAGDHVVTITPQTRGLYRWHFHYNWDGVDRSNEAMFTVFPVLPVMSRFDTASVLGTHNPPNIRLIYKLFQTMGMKWNRWWDIGGSALWYSVEPSDGVYNWSSTDAVMNNDRNLNAMSLVMLGTCYFPQWVYDIQGGWDQCTTGWQFSNPVGYAQMFVDEYARPVAQHLLGKANYYEVGNEVYFQWSGTEANYVTLLNHVSTALKAVDPANQVVAVAGPSPGYPGFDTNYQFYKAIFAAGGLNYMDILSVHMYITQEQFGQPIGPGSELAIRDWASTLRALMAQYGGPVRPIWDSESSVIPQPTSYTVPNQTRFYSGDLVGTTTPTPAEHAAYGARILAIHYVEDVKWFYYTNIATNHATGFCEYDGTPIPLAVAWAEFAKEVEGGHFAETLNICDGVQAYLIDRGGTPVVILWITSYTPFQKALLTTTIQAVEIVTRDMFGNDMTNTQGEGGLLIEASGSPVYLIGQGITGAQLKQKLLQQPLAIADVKALPDKTLVTIEPSNVTGVFADYLYIENAERSAGIRVIGSHPANVGNVVSVSGVLGTADGERYITAWSVIP